MKVIETKRLTKLYGAGQAQVTALDNASLSVDEGEFVAVMGPSGSGKSTLLHLMGGLDAPSSGEILLDDINLAALSDKQLTLARRRNIGFVFQFFNLLPTLTAAENVALPLVIAGKKPRQFRPRVENMLSVVGLEDRKDHKPDQLSGGQQQRVALARALVAEPRILMADEPTGNLDSKSGNEILELLCKSCAELRQTIVMVTHDPKAASYAHRVVFLKDGRIVDEISLKGTHDTAVIIAGLKKLEG